MRSRKLLNLFLIAFFLLPALSLLSFLDGPAAPVTKIALPSGDPGDHGDHPTLAIGAQAPDFSLKGVDGKTYTLASFKNAKIMVVVFTCNHCPTAQAYEDRLIQLTKDYGDKGVAVIAMMPNDPSSIRLDELGYTDMGDSYEEMKLRAKGKTFQLSLSIRRRHTEAAAIKYAARSPPRTLFYLRQGKKAPL